MKLLVIILIFLVSSINNGICQTFNLSDTIFSIGEKYIPASQNINFDYDTDSILTESYPILDSVVFFLKENTNLTIEIGVHTDTRGSDYLSRRLDSHRAESVKKYLTSKGISISSIIAKGYWSNYPIISDAEIQKMKTIEEKEKAHQKNRRTEFKILSTNNEN